MIGNLKVIWKERIEQEYAEAKRRRGEEAKRRRGEEAKRRRGEEAKKGEDHLDSLLTIPL